MAFISDLRSFGSLPIYLFLIVVSYFFDKLLSYRLFVALAITFIIFAIIRFFYFKQRPNKQGYSNLIEKLDASSFPSLHTARATLLAVIFLLNFNFGFWLMVIISLIIPLTAFERIYHKKHDIIDVVFGFLFALIIAYATNILI